MAVMMGGSGGGDRGDGWQWWCKGGEPTIYNINNNSGATS